MSHHILLIGRLNAAVGNNKTVLTTSLMCAVYVVQKNQRELAKMRKCLRPEELVSHMSQMDTQTQHEELEKSYQVVVEDYRRIIERLATQA